MMPGPFIRALSIQHVSDITLRTIITPFFFVTFISHHCLLVFSWENLRPPLINWLGFTHLNTRIHVRLLGPCFKTGRLSSFRQYLWKGVSVRTLVFIPSEPTQVTCLSPLKQKETHHKKTAPSVKRRPFPSRSFYLSPQNRVKNATSKETITLHSTNPHLAMRRRIKSPFSLDAYRFVNSYWPTK